MLSLTIDANTFLELQAKAMEALGFVLASPPVTGGLTSDPAPEIDRSAKAAPTDAAIRAESTMPLAAPVEPKAPGRRGRPRKEVMVVTEDFLPPGSSGSVSAPVVAQRPNQIDLFGAAAPAAVEPSAAVLTLPAVTHDEMKAELQKLASTSEDGFNQVSEILKAFDYRKISEVEAKHFHPIATAARVVLTGKTVAVALTAVGK